MDTTIPNPVPKQTRFYVTMKRDSRTAWLSGPYETHAEALARVEEVRERVSQLDPWTWFDAFGTSSITREGALFPLGVLEKLDAKDARHAPAASGACSPRQIIRNKAADRDPGQGTAESEEGRSTGARKPKGE
jgi:hypothetical protein